MKNKKDYIMDRMFKGSTGLAQGIFVSLGIGLLLENLGKMLGLELLVTLGIITKSLMAPAIGVGVATALGSNLLTVFSSMSAATLGAAALTITPGVGVLVKSGEPIGAVLAAIVATYVGKKVSGKTKLDMMLVPSVSILVGGVFGVYASGVIAPILNFVGGAITGATESNLLVSCIVIAIIWGLLLVSPASSVALAVALSLNETASAAALVGCTAQFVGFLIMSWKDNDAGAKLAIGLCTPKVQLPNITKNWKVLIPSLVAGAIASPIAVMGFGLVADTSIAGMGLSSLVAPINILSTQGLSTLLLGFGVGAILIPGVISFGIYSVMKKKGLIKTGDLVVPS